MFLSLLLLQVLSPEEEAEKLRRTVFVGNVPAKKSSVTQLRDLFSK